MARLACVDVYALPMQLLLAKQRSWADRPVVVVDEDKPNGVILWTNAKAHAKGIVRGMRYSAGLSLDGTLRAGVISASERAGGEAKILKLLRHYTPHIDDTKREQGTFILDASGLGRLYPSLEYWARAISAELKGHRLRSHIVVGYQRFHCYAIAKASAHPIAVFDDEAKEERIAMQVPLERLLFDTQSRDILHKLGVTTLGDLIALPESGLKKRFGPEIATLWQLASKQRLEPLANAPEEQPLTTHAILDFSETDAERLLFLIKRLLHPLLATLADRGHALKQLQIVLDNARQEHIAPAQPSLDATLLLDLIRLKLGAIALSGGVKEVRLVAESSEAQREQLSLFRESSKRDIKAAERAFARLRAEFGEEAVCFAKLREGHLPEARFQWQPAVRLTTPEPRRHTPPQLVRRFHPKAVQLPLAHQKNPEGWMIAGLQHGPVQQMLGPYVVSGGWWRRREIQRDYYFVQVTRGDWLWVYYDHALRTWQRAGRLE